MKQYRVLLSNDHTSIPIQADYFESDGDEVTFYAESEDDDDPVAVGYFPVVLGVWEAAASV